MITLRGASSYTPVLVCLLAVSLCSLCAACASLDTLADYAEDITQLEARQQANPDDPEPLRKLGAIYLKTKRPQQAHDYLSKAFALDPTHSQTRLRLGLAKEALDDRQSALDLYSQYADVPRTSRYRRRMHGRYRQLLRAVAREEITRRLDAERGIETLEVIPEAVAVYPLAYTRDGPDSLLGQGLAEMIMLDLAQVERVRVVERVRREVLMEELKRRGHAGFNQTSVPEMGRWLGAGGVVVGTYDVSASTLTVQTEFLDVTSERRGRGGGSDDLEDLFQLKTALVFDLLENQMIISVTEEERRAIETVPTMDYQAFLAFSQGLHQEEQGNLEEALQHYQDAFSSDPNFLRAQDNLDAIEGERDMEGTTQVMIGIELPDVSPSGTLIDLLGDHTSLLNENINSHFTPGLDAREPASETTIRAGPIPVPPPPPSGGQ